MIKENVDAVFKPFIHLGDGGRYFIAGRNIRLDKERVVSALAYFIGKRGADLFLDVNYCNICAFSRKYF